MPIDIYRIDDRLIHGQVVVGWGQPLNLRFIVLVDDEVACCDWERELYRMGVPPNFELHFETVAGAAENFGRYVRDRRHGILVTRDIAAMAKLAALVPEIRTVNVGGLHYSEGRHERLRYVFLTEEEEQALRGLAQRGVVVTAQDLPATRAVPLEELLVSRRDGA